MGYNLITGLSDLSGELGESTVKQDTRRIGAYNDAVQMFADERKWQFLVKTNEDLTTDSSTKSYAIPSGMSDRRSPNGIKSIYIGDSDTPLAPEEYYFDDDETHLLFTNPFATSGETIKIYYYYIPTRLSNPETTTELFPIPDSKRKVVATLAAAFVQWSRYLDAQGNRLYNLYQKLAGKSEIQQSERNNGSPKKFVHPLKRIGFRRTYP